MYLLIDNSEPETVCFFYRLDTKWVQACFLAGEEDSLLGLIDKLLKNLKRNLSDLKGVAVTVGKGRFTATRIATTVANTLSYALGIPVTAVDDAGTENLESIISNTEIGRYISAKYSGEAHIGKKKH